MTKRKPKIDNIVKQTSIDGNHDNNIDDWLETSSAIQTKRKTIKEESKIIIEHISSKGLKLLKING